MVVLPLDPHDFALDRLYVELCLLVSNILGYGKVVLLQVAPLLLQVVELDVGLVLSQLSSQGVVGSLGLVQILLGHH